MRGLLKWNALHSFLVVGVIKMGKWISQQGLNNLKNHQYICVDHSFCSWLFLNAYWRSCIVFIPGWMAPNLITFLGLLCVMAQLPWVAYYSPDLATETPRFLYFSYALAVWVYTTLVILEELKQG